MDSGEVPEPSTPRPPPSAFAAIAEKPWEAAVRHSPGPSRGASPGLSLAAGSLGDGQRRKGADHAVGRRSLNVGRQPATLAQCKPAAALWRTSTAVSESAASQGLSFAALCGDSYISPDDLHRPRLLGEGAFAVVDTAQLVRPPSSSHTGTTNLWPAGGAPCAHVQTVAVKRLKPHVLESEGDVLSFIQEARLLVNLRHPSIVEYIGLGAVDQSCPEAEWRTMYLVQEYANAGTLKKLLLTQMINPIKKLFSLEDAVRWAHQVAEGLAYLHQLNPMIIHRDLKAENVLLTRDSDGRTNAKLADFGLHKLVRRPGKAALNFYHIKEEESIVGSALTSPNLSQHGSNAQHGDPSLRVTADASSQSLNGAGQAGWQHGALLKAGLALPAGPAHGASSLKAIRERNKYDMTGQTGALTYMAPEVLLGNKYNEKVDVFSFGMVLYELLHRKMVVADLMYLGSTAEAEAFAFKVAAGYRCPTSPELPDSLRQLITDCLAGDCDLRPSMDEVARRLEAVRQSGELAEHEHLHGPANGPGGCCAVM